MFTITIKCAEQIILPCRSNVKVIPGGQRLYRLYFINPACRFHILQGPRRILIIFIANVHNNKTMCRAKHLVMLGQGHTARSQRSYRQYFIKPECPLDILEVYWWFIIIFSTDVHNSKTLCSAKHSTMRVQCQGHYERSKSYRQYFIKPLCPLHIPKAPWRILITFGKNVQNNIMSISK